MMPDIPLTGVLVVAAIALPVPLVLGLAPTLHVPSVVLEIVAGLLIGPAILGLVEVNCRYRCWPCSASRSCCSWPEINLNRLRGARLRSAAASFGISLAVALGIGLGLDVVGLIVTPLLVVIILLANSPFVTGLTP